MPPRARLLALLLFCASASAGCLLDPSGAFEPPSPRLWRLPRATSARGENPDLRHTEEDLAAFVEMYVAGHTPDGAPLEARLESFEPLRFPVEQGKCYVFAYRLGEGAALSARARRRFTAAVRLPEEVGTRVSSAMHGPGGAGAIGCPRVSGEATMGFVAGDDARRPDSDLGEGPIEVQLFSRALAEP